MASRAEKSVSKESMEEVAGWRLLVAGYEFIVIDLPATGNR
jgi:hypothetical protein